MAQFNQATGLAEGSFGIGTYALGGKVFPGLVQPDGTVFDISHLYADTHLLFDDWDRALDTLVDLSAKGGETGLQFKDLECLPPVAHPNMICTGSNYRQHVAEMMTHNKFNQDKRKPGESDESFFKRNLEEVDRRSREGMPFFWTGLHSSLAGANADIPMPIVGEHHDWELELGVIVARSERYVNPEDGDRLIAGYVMVNDLGTVDEATRPDTRFEFDWVSKHQPNFKPAGPFVVPKQFVNFSDIQIKMKLNGVIKQDWSVTDMIFKPEQILAYASERLRLMPGDLMITGSPPGNGAMHGGRYMEPGDVIDSELTYLGRQHNRCVEDKEGLERGAHYGSFQDMWGRYRAKEAAGK